MTDTPGPQGADTAGSVDDESRVRLTAHVRGHVQGVGFRWWVRSRALALGLTGHAANLADGRVEVVAEGPREAVDALLAALRAAEPDGRPGRVDWVGERLSPARGGSSGFEER